jgi:hypothetical protein
MPLWQRSFSGLRVILAQVENYSPGSIRKHIPSTHVLTPVADHSESDLNGMRPGHSVFEKRILKALTLPPIGRGWNLSSAGTAISIP